ncbi:hypothetical protein [Prevotella lacticifex]|uniref:Uncharacterized protein n=1 Tax=Prevotella lacticifex TaxID=2854755 RepID=A0A9R1CZB4_9BACT|nr:hypothetical protein [Prevotella lacticifex]GJG36527.1 hypothetical protein PRLR5003_16840 [Prevotella lacticifex]GJG38386.1 hypothetical protein PRLR5019_03570 [Prevotella lacticifex]GJG42931.1 hypothetical protein PRLR5025_17170 [Prevotella lacticifex]GJG44743.1 hypothetical protein PRLR5027_03380 [Prevotella lacticifex]GJG49282.1 hypothetical protein PRLR5052_16950 [Prevotella lacticifex]
MEAIDSIDTIEAIATIKAINSIDTLEAIASIETINSIAAIATIELHKPNDKCKYYSNVGAFLSVSATG